MLNAISHHPDFLRSSLEKMFEEKPLDFIDIGSVGGIHPIILPFASRTKCTCFEPEQTSFNALQEAYMKSNPFANLTIHQTAVSGSRSKKNLYCTRSSVNTSLLEPDSSFALRYGIAGLEVKEKLVIDTDCLDTILSTGTSNNGYSGEFIKIDCQGVEFEILQGSSETMERHTVALICEVEFSEVYKEQKTFSEVNMFLKDMGFILYGLQPHFISSRRLDRKTYETEERILWADALYFKDPLVKDIAASKALTRQTCTLFLIAVLTHYYDFALEILDAFNWDSKDKKHLLSLVHSCARNKRRALERDVDILAADISSRPSSKYLITKKFLDNHRSNNSVDFIK